MNNQEQTYKTYKITVNGKPLSRELVIDSVTYVPVNISESHMHEVVQQSALT